MSTFEITITWECPAEGHDNCLTSTFDNISFEDADLITESIVTDPSIMRDNPCHICQSVGFNDVGYVFKEIHNSK